MERDERPKPLIIFLQYSIQPTARVVGAVGAVDIGQQVVADTAGQLAADTPLVVEVAVGHIAVGAGVPVVTSSL